MRKEFVFSGMRGAKSKRGQVGDTVTWFVATIVIVVILLFFVFGASMLGSTKSVGKYKESITSKASYQGDDVFLKKSVFTYLSVSQSTLKSKISRYFDLADEEGRFELSAKDVSLEVGRNYGKKK